MKYKHPLTSTENLLPSPFFCRKCLEPSKSTYVTAIFGSSIQSCLHSVHGDWGFKQSFHIFMVTSWVNNWWGSDQSPWIRAISCCHAMPLFPWVAAAAWFEDIAEEAAAQFSSAEAGGICLNGERRVQFVQKTLQHRLKVYGMKWHLRNSGSSFVSCSFLHVLLTSVSFWSKSFFGHLSLGDRSKFLWISTVLDDGMSPEMSPGPRKRSSGPWSTALKWPRTFVERGTSLKKALYQLYPTLSYFLTYIGLIYTYP